MPSSVRCAAAMKSATEAGTSACRETPCLAAMVKVAEGSGTHSNLTARLAVPSSGAAVAAEGSRGGLRMVENSATSAVESPTCEATSVEIRPVVKVVLREM
jgi:hypothetical protein